MPAGPTGKALTGKMAPLRKCLSLLPVDLQHASEHLGDVSVRLQLGENNTPAPGRPVAREVGCEVEHASRGLGALFKLVGVHQRLPVGLDGCVLLSECGRE
jgi:hypothetical protein